MPGRVVAAGGAEWRTLRGDGSRAGRGGAYGWWGAFRLPTPHPATPERRGRWPLPSDHEAALRGRGAKTFLCADGELADAAFDERLRLERL